MCKIAETRTQSNHLQRGRNLWLCKRDRGRGCDRHCPGCTRNGISNPGEPVILATLVWKYQTARVCGSGFAGQVCTRHVGELRSWRRARLSVRLLLSERSRGRRFSTQSDASCQPCVSGCTPVLK